MKELALTTAILAALFIGMVLYTLLTLHVTALMLAYWVVADWLPFSISVAILAGLGSLPFYISHRLK